MERGKRKTGATTLLQFSFSIPVSSEKSTEHIYKRLRWSRGSVLAFGTQVRGLKPGRSRPICRAKKSSARLPSEGKKSRRSLNLRGSRNLGKITTGHLSRPQFHLSLLGSLASLRTQRHVVTKVGTSKSGEKQWQTIPKNLPRMQCAKSHIGSITGLWFLPEY